MPPQTYLRRIPTAENPVNKLSCRVSETAKDCNLYGLPRKSRNLVVGTCAVEFYLCPKVHYCVAQR